jgi:hypothetical protein
MFRHRRATDQFRIFLYPEWVTKVMHPELEGTGPAEYDLAKVEQWFPDE